MNKAQLTKLISYKSGSAPQKVIERAVNLILNELTRGLCDGGTAEIRNFGVLSSKRKQEVNVNHPATQKLVTIASHRYVHCAYSSGAIEKVTAIGRHCERETRGNPIYNNQPT